MLKKICNRKIIYLLIVLIFLASVSIYSVSGIKTVNNNSDPEILADFTYQPTSHDFEKMLKGQTDSTSFQIWTCGSCGNPPLSYSLSWDDNWLDVSPKSGTSEGEKDTIKINIDTTGLSLGIHTSDIKISSNLGGASFTVKVNIVENTPILKIINIRSGLGRIVADIENTGDKPADNIDWSMSVEGGFFQFLNLESNGNINSIKNGEKATASSKLFFGLGKITITVTAMADNADKTIENLADARVFGFILL